MIVLFLFELRILNHYIGQYFILTLMGVPVTNYTQHWHRVELVYAGWLFYQDVVMVAFGALVNTFVFLWWVLIQRQIKFLTCKYPALWYKVLCW